MDRKKFLVDARLSFMVRLSREKGSKSQGGGCTGEVGGGGTEDGPTSKTKNPLHTTKLQELSKKSQAGQQPLRILEDTRKKNKNIIATIRKPNSF